MPNRSLRERFGFSEAKSASISQVFAATIEEKFIEVDKTARRVASYGQIRGVLAEFPGILGRVCLPGRNLAPTIHSAAGAKLV
jgi:hypothetical protein